MPAFVLRCAALLAVGLAVFALLRGSGPDGSVDAGTAVRLDIAGLVDASELVLEARVLEFWVLEDSASGRIETEYLLEVERTFVGNDEPLRSVRLPGGVLPDGRGLLIAGVPRLQVGEERLLFLSARSDGGELRMPVGLSQGALRLERRFDGSKRLVREGLDVALLGGSQGAALHGAQRHARDYAEVVAEVHAAVAARAARGSGR